MKDNEITDERAKRVAAARRRLARLKLASVTASVIGFGALSGSIAAATPMVATANTAASTSTASAPSSNSSAAASMINARAETAGTKPAFRDALKSRRCLIPADAFYEWVRMGNAKQPYCFEVNEGELFAFAGIWDCWKDLSGNAVETCSILTTTPNALTSAVHNRMPVILEPDNYDLWLDPGMRDVAAASELLKPCDARLMRCHPVSSRVNHVANDDAECSKPVELAQTQSGLFS